MVINYNIDIEDKILDDIFYLIKNYIITNKEVDERFLKSIFEIVRDYKNLKKYLNEIKINNEMTLKGSYDWLSKNIEINLNKFNKELESFKLFNAHEMKIYKYIYISRMVIHELEHANQKKIKEFDNSLESKILKYAEKNEEEYLKVLENKDKISLLKEEYLSLKFLIHKKNYKKYYIYAPQERLAYIKSTSSSLNLAKSFEIEKIIDYENSILNLELINGYMKLLNPTEYYLKKINPKFNMWDEIENMSKEISLKEKIILGLEINKEEYKSLYNNVESSLNILEKKYKY